MAAAANRNFFSLLDDDEADDFTAAKYSAAPAAAPAMAAQKPGPKKPGQQQPHQQSSAQGPAKLPSKPLPPAEAVRAEREAHSERGRGRGYGRRGRAGGDSFPGGRGGFRDPGEGEFHRPSFETGGRGRGRRGGFTRPFDGDDKRKENEAPVVEEGKPANETSEEAEQKKPEAPEDKEMTLDEYEKIMQEKRKNLGQLKERKVEADKELKKMQIVDKKRDADVFIKLGSDKEKLKKKESSEKEKKAVPINEFLKPAEGERYSPRGGRSGRGREIPGGRFSSVAAAAAAAAAAPAFEDGHSGVQSPSNIDNPQEFPQLGKSK